MVFVDSTYLTTLRKKNTECRYISNIFESGVYELREKKYLCISEKFEIIVKYKAVKIKIKLKNLQEIITLNIHKSI